MANKIASLLRGPVHDVHPDASTIIKRALSDLASLVDEGAPRSVIGAANYAVDCARANVPPQRWAAEVLFDYAAKRAAQDRYGKLRGEGD